MLLLAGAKMQALLQYSTSLLQVYSAVEVYDSKADIGKQWYAFATVSHVHSSFAPWNMEHSTAQ